MRFFWLCTGIFAVFAALILFATLASAKGAPQEASGAAIALCCAVIPYVFTRAMEGWQTATWPQEMLNEAKRIPNQLLATSSPRSPAANHLETHTPTRAPAASHA
jgi:hypothetical protein